MASKSEKTSRGERLSLDELARFYDELNGKKQLRNLLQPGFAYLFVQSYGWARVAFYLAHESPFMIRLAHCCHFRHAGKDYGRLLREGVEDQEEWRYEGNALINVNHTLGIFEYFANVPRGPIGSVSS